MKIDRHRKTHLQAGQILLLMVFASMAVGVEARTEFSQAPQLVENPSGRVPLAAVIEFVAKPGLAASVELTDGEHTWGAEFGPETFQEGHYKVPLLGMRPDRDHQISLTLKRDSATVHRQSFQHRTPPRPDNQLKFPFYEVVTAKPDRMEPGVTFLSVRRRALGRSHWLTDKQYDWSTRWGMLLAIDNQGEVVWWFESDSRTSGVARLNNGNIMMHRANFSTLEIDLLGNVVGMYYAEGRPQGVPDNPAAIPIKNQQTLHHQPHQMPNGDFLAFSANGYLIEDYYTSDTDPDAPRKDRMVMADTVVQFNPQGEQVWTWSTMDYLDPFRLGKDTFWSYWWVRGFPDHVDWTHANGLSYDASDDSVLVSLRNQSAILKVDRKTKDIKWILGRHKDWSAALQGKLLTPVGKLMWPAYQHNPRMTHAGTVILFDNRAYGGALAFEDALPVHKGFSRGVEFEVDEAAMTVKQIWSSGDSQGEDPCFTNAMSDAWRLPKTDNRLVIHAFCIPLAEGLTEDIMDETRRAPDDLPYGGRVLEYDGDEVVFRADFKDPDDLIQWNVYGGFRSPGMYHQAGSASH